MARRRFESFADKLRDSPYGFMRYCYWLGVSISFALIAAVIALISIIVVSMVDSVGFAIVIAILIVALILQAFDEWWFQ